MPLVLAKQPPLDEIAPPEGAVFLENTSADQVRETVKGLLSVPRRLRKMGDRNRQVAVENFTWDVVAEKHLEIFENFSRVGRLEDLTARKLGRRIVILSPFIFRYFRGIERSSIHLANEFARLGYRVTFMTWEGKEKEPISPLDPRVRLVKIPYVRYFRSFWAAPFYIRDFIQQSHDVAIVFFCVLWGSAGNTFGEDL